VGLQVVSLALGAYGTKCYLVAREGADEAAVVDPGDEPEAVVAALEQQGWAPAGILITHGHHDHLGAVHALAEQFGIEVWMPAGEADDLRRLERADPHEPDHLLEGGETVELAGISFRVHPVPGHSRASVAYSTDGVVFSGDVLFAGSIGRTDLEGGDLDTLLASIGSLIDQLPPDTVVASGHGPATTLERERQGNPFLEAMRG
jgi:glyoxylase-like metal-dependent hydrolase (beta-lactamase superfamily II)